MYFVAAAAAAVACDWRMFSARILELLLKRLRDCTDELALGGAVSLLTDEFDEDSLYRGSYTCSRWESRSDRLATPICSPLPAD